MKSTKCLLAGLAVASAAGVSSAAIMAGDSAMVDFNSAGDAALFQVLRDDTPSNPGIGIAQNAGLGINAAGGVHAVDVGGVNGSNDIAALYAPGGFASGNGSIILNANDQLTLSVDFKTSDNIAIAATPRLGIASLVDTQAATAGGNDINSGKDIIGDADWADGIATNLIGNTGARTFNIVNSVFGDGRTTVADPDFVPDVATETWYQFQLEVLKSTTADTFEVTTTLNVIDPTTGAFVSEYASFSETIVNASLYADSSTGVLAGMTFVAAGSGATVTNEYDNLSIAVENVPEPGSIALLGLGGLLIARRRRK